MIGAPTIAQTATGDRVIASVKATDWAITGDNQAHERVADAKAEGGTAIRITVPNDGGSTAGAAVQTKVNTTITTGDRVRVTAWLKGVSTVAGGPAKAIVKLKDSGKSYGIYAQKTFELTSEWKPYSAEFVATRDFAAGSTAMVVQFAVGRQVVDVGQATTTIVAQ
ncbi:carbohydrate binding domain-containing protein [Sphingomonas sp. Leaf25]|uniref:carbohydrate binding domain-containing protein n=1 Tax=Sphingomonas sp. Leaf25 TaxID=1735692 RepID=UPI00138F8BE3|nr:carbohydrate binding domain-containing protein [Sphingomonas sp. Leaf25]